MKISQNIMGGKTSVSEYNTNNAWYYNGNNGTVNNNNKYNTYQVRPVLEFGSYDNSLLDSYLITLAQWGRVYLLCRKKKRKKPSQLVFEYDYVRRIVRLTHMVGNMEYTLCVAIEFMITYPKPREVIAADFTDRMVQTWYCQQVMPLLEEHHLHPDSYACRVGKGGLRAIYALRDYLRLETNNWTEDAYIASRDIESFFMSIDCVLAVEKMNEFIRKWIPDSDPRQNLLIYLTRIIYLSLPQEDSKRHSPSWMWDKYPPNKSLNGRTNYIGTAIGNVTAQMMAAFLMSFYLWYVDSLGYRFVFYTDDIFIIIKDKAKWKMDEILMEAFLETELHLKMHPKKKYMQHWTKGCLPLGSKLKGERILPSDRLYNNIMYCVNRAIKMANDNQAYIYLEKENFMCSMNSYMGLIIHYNTYNLRKSIFEKLKASPWVKVFDFEVINYSKVVIKKRARKEMYEKRRCKERKRILMEEVRVAMCPDK